MVANWQLSCLWFEGIAMTERISALSDVLVDYDIVLCDVWGVLHHGEMALPSASDALVRARQAGATVVLITNSPRGASGVITQLKELGVSRDAFDGVVSSGDASRRLVEAGPRKVFLIGPDRKSNFFDGLPLQFVPALEAECIICTGFFSDKDVPADYAELLSGFVRRSVPMVCANPDLWVKKGDEILPCAGAIAEFYESLGGKTVVAGKPHAPIYDMALEATGRQRHQIDKARVLAIGDGLLTDVRGAKSFGLDLLYIAMGVHARDYLADNQVNETSLAEWFNRANAAPDYWMPELA